MRVKDIMTREVVALHEDDEFSSVFDLMKLKKIRNIPIVDTQNQLVGLITYKEIIEAIAKNIRTLKIKEMMIKEVKAVEPETPLKGVVEVMLLNKYGCLPVVNNDRTLVGIITVIDLLKVLYDTSTMPSGFYKEG